MKLLVALTMILSMTTETKGDVRRNVSATMRNEIISLVACFLSGYFLYILCCLLPQPIM
jgi:hypothetical protein